MLGSQVLGLNPGSACVCLVTFGKLVFFSVPASQIPDLEWRPEDGEVTQAHNPFPETLGQRGFRFQNLLFYNGHMVHLPYVS